MKVVNQNPAVISDPPSQVLIDSLGSATLNLTIYFGSIAMSTALVKVASQLMRELVNTYLAEQVSMPDDARERIILNSETEQSQTIIRARLPKHQKHSTDHSLMMLAVMPMIYANKLINLATQNKAVILSKIYC